MKILLIFAIIGIITISGCINNLTDEKPKLINGYNSGKSFQFDRYILNNISINGDLIILNISYSGGCKEHEFDLVWNGEELQSLPPQYPVFLAHDSKDDNCNSLITENLEFDLSLLKEGKIKKPDKVIIAFVYFEEHILLYYNY